MRYFFAYATCGQKAGGTVNICATLLAEKNLHSIFLGNLIVLCPENYIRLQPPKPYRDCWSQAEIFKIVQFGNRLANILAGSETPPNEVIERKYYHDHWYESIIFLLSGKPVVMRDNCSQCGTCVKLCPYNAISISSDIEDGYPVCNTEKCMSCGRCFNICPCNAVEFPKAHTQFRTRYPEPNLSAPGNVSDNEIISQPFPSGFSLNKRQFLGSKCPLITLIIVIILVIVAVGIYLLVRFVFKKN